jgi:hypothetical protein
MYELQSGILCLSCPQKDESIRRLASDVARLTAELAAAPKAARRWSAIRAAVATVQAATGLGGDTPLDDDAVAELLSGALQNASRGHFAEAALRTDAEATARTLEHHRRLFVGQQARAERAELELAAAQAERDRMQAMVPRLEWRPYLGGCELRLCIDAHSQVLFTAEQHYKPDRYNLSADHEGDEEVLWECPAAEVFAFIAEWHAANLPNYPLPDFPGTL